jgi:hypothetical protein
MARGQAVTQTNPAHVFEAMEYLQWRDVLLPVQDWEHRFAHDTVQHHIIYRSGVAIDMLGAQARTFSYVLPLRQGILRAPFSNAFTAIYYRFYEAYRDKTADTLIDPVHGAIWAVPGEWNAATTPEGMDGVSVRVSFTEDVPVDGAKTDSPPTFDGVEGEAASFDEEIAAIQWTREVMPEPTTDPLSAITGFGQQVNRSIEKSKAHFSRIAQKANEAESTCEELQRNGVPGMNGPRLAARKLRVDATRVANASPIDAPGQVISIVLDAPKSLVQIARDTGMEISELIRLNAGIARLPFVAAGVPIFVTRKRKRRR